MKIQTPNGEAQGMPLSDIQQNTKSMKLLAISLSVAASVVLVYILWLTNYIIKYDVIGNILRACIAGT